MGARNSEPALPNGFAHEGIEIAAAVTGSEITATISEMTSNANLI
jgi:hypothetical protein